MTVFELVIIVGPCLIGVFIGWATERFIAERLEKKKLDDTQKRMDLYKKWQDEFIATIKKDKNRDCG